MRLHRIALGGYVRYRAALRTVPFGIAVVMLLCACTSDRQAEGTVETDRPAASATGTAQPTETSSATADDSAGNSPPTPQQTPNAAQDRTPVTPIVASAGVTIDHILQVSGYVPGILEPSGTCIWSITIGSETVEQSTDASPDATSMSCSMAELPFDGYNATSITAALRYESPTATGQSGHETMRLS